ncbi:MAG: hypothetical protein Q8S33_00585, partial [Myxococcales bacterium]|nr:hypothetical protein [Myxococcales bacterium]
SEHQPGHHGAGDRLRVECPIGFTAESVIDMRGMRIIDAGVIDAGVIDAGNVDASDAGSGDAGDVDAGSGDAGASCWPRSTLHQLPAALLPPYMTVSPTQSQPVVRLFFERDGTVLTPFSNSEDGGLLFGDDCPVNTAITIGAPAVVPAPWGFDILQQEPSGGTTYLRAIPRSGLAAPPLSHCRVLPGLEGVRAGTGVVDDGGTTWFNSGRGPIRSAGVLRLNSARNLAAYTATAGSAFTQGIWPISESEFAAVAFMTDGGRSLLRGLVDGGTNALARIEAATSGCHFIGSPDRVWCVDTSESLIEVVADGGIRSLFDGGVWLSLGAAMLRRERPIIVFERATTTPGMEYQLLVYGEQWASPQLIVSSSSRFAAGIGERPDGGIVIGYWPPPYAYGQTPPFIYGEYCPP